MSLCLCLCLASLFFLQRENANPKFPSSYRLPCWRVFVQEQIVFYSNGLQKFISKKSVQRLVPHNTVSGWIVKLFCPQFVICYQSPSISLNRRLFGRKKLGGGEQHWNQSTPHPHPCCCFLPISSSAWILLLSPCILLRWVPGRVKLGPRQGSLLPYFPGVEQVARHHLGTAGKKEPPYSWCPLSPLEIFLSQCVLYSL